MLQRSKGHLVKVFDCHLHIIDHRFPLVPNQGYLPQPFTSDDYLRRMQPYRLAGGAVVSGSFQGFDQGYLLDALQRLGPTFVGVTQLPATVSDAEVLALAAAGVKAVRFNVQRGGSAELDHLESMAHRLHELAGWHVELYVDSNAVAALFDRLIRLPAVSIDHLGLSQAGLPTVLRLAERGVRVKATGFGRVDFPVVPALRALHAANPGALMFGTDLPSTRAPRPFEDADIGLIGDALGDAGLEQVMYLNAWQFYRMETA